MNRREKTRAIKKELRKAGFPVVSVTHGSGVAAKWINIKLFMEENRLNEISQEVERLAARTVGRENLQENCITISCCFRSRQEMKMRGCDKCEELKPLTEFSKDRTKKDGFSVLCKKCKSSYRKEYKNRDPEKYSAQAAGCRKRYKILHPGRIKALAKKLYNQDPKVINNRQEREAKRVDKALHPEKYRTLEREKAKAYWDKNREKINAQRRDRLANDPVFRAKEKEREKKRKHQRRALYIKRRERDPEKYRAKGKAIYARAMAKDPGKYMARSRKSQQKRKAEKTRIMLLKAFDIVQSELTDVNGHKERLEKARAKIKARQECEEKKEDKILHPEKYKAQAKAQAKERALAYYYKNREKLLAKAKAKRAREPEKNLAYGRKYFHKRHGGMTKFMHVIAEILLTINLLKGINHDDGKIEQKKKLA